MAWKRQCVRTACCLSLLIGTSLFLRVTQAQPQEKIADHHSRKRSYHSSWNHQQIHRVLQHVDLASQAESPSSTLTSSSNTAVTRLPAFLNVTHLSPRSFSSSRLRHGKWRFVIASKSAKNTIGFTTPTSTIRDVEQRTSRQQAFVSQRSSSNFHNSLWQRLLDDFNFKGYGVSFYKSLMALNKVGIAFRLPLLNHWDWWDSNPALPSIGLMFCIYYPFNLSMCVTSSMRLDVLKCWFTKSLFLLQAAMWQFLHHLVSAIWTIVSVLLYPIQQTWRPVPFQLDQRAANATAQSKEHTVSYNSAVQERLGTSYWYRWTPAVGFDSRISVWHLYMPTLEVYSQLLTGSKDRLFGPWWKSHFASLGLDSAVSNAMFSGTGVLSLSGLRFKTRRSKSNNNKEDRSLRETLKVPTVSVNDVKDKSSLGIISDSMTTKATLSTILHEERDKYDDGDGEVSSARIKVMRGGNSTRVSSNFTSPST
ncbi:hypothetical protein IV203_013422 [Nitzschia inconspicua]|uniref:Uncharacterized protein n=1 Tax=Nitzschia inconspicua TaxID=303405 RepID=A0A9K3M5A3_9STRA|nr:hypothetical protein IV203_013422 [Nitzschia inconspicua]